MTKFKDLLSEGAFHKNIHDPSVTLAFENSDVALSLRFDSKDEILAAGYSGGVSPWFSSLCSMLIGKTLEEALAFTPKTWEEHFKSDQSFWDIKQEEEACVLNLPLELLKAALNIFRGRDYLYKEESPLICRCFGIREKDILEHLQKNEAPTLESLSGETKAGMGCRTCVPQLKRWVALHEPKNKHYYKEKAISEWLLEIDYLVSCFPEALDWKMEVKSFKGKQVLIAFDKDASQREEEEVGRRLQDFLGAALDPELAFFLRRARHFSKANG